MSALQQLRLTAAREYRQVTTGTYHKNRNGRRVPDTVGVEYITTPSGRYPLAEWVVLVEKAILEDKKEELLRLLEAHVAKHCAWLKTTAHVHEYALECLVDEAYLAWEDFAPPEDNTVS